MKIYVGQARGSSLIARLSALGYGEMIVPKEYPPRRLPYALDNGVFGAWKAKKPWERKDSNTFVDVLASIAASASAPRPDFIVCPDKIAEGEASLRYSESWVGRVRALLPNVPVYLPVQDYMTEAQVWKASRNFDGLFVGGTVEWKLATGIKWVQLAKSVDMPCHIGRVGGKGRVIWSRWCGADSIDSCVPLFSEENLQAFRNGIDAEM